MTKRQQILAHVLSLVLMVLTIHIAYQLSYEFAHYTFFVLGCFAFGWIWREITNYFIYDN
jgi:hypothetical protein